MAHITDQEFVTRVLAATIDGKIDWQPTAELQQYTASLGGKWTILVGEYFSGIRGAAGEPGFDYALTLKDSAGDQLLRIEDGQDGRIRELHELARRRALKVNEAIEDFLKELDEPQS